MRRWAVKGPIPGRVVKTRPPEFAGISPRRDVRTQGPRKAPSIGARGHPEGCDSRGEATLQTTLSLSQSPDPTTLNSHETPLRTNGNLKRNSSLAGRKP